jgi:hypothetical protein
MIGLIGLGLLAFLAFMCVFIPCLIETRKCDVLIRECEEIRRRIQAKREAQKNA